RSLRTFGPKHLRGLGRRLLYRHLLADFTVVSFFLMLGIPLLGFGLAFGGFAWVRSIASGVPATAGTVMLAAVTAFGGLYCLVPPLLHDLVAVPQRPLTPPRLGVVAAPALAQRDT